MVPAWYPQRFVWGRPAHSGPGLVLAPQLAAPAHRPATIVQMCFQHGSGPDWGARTQRYAIVLPGRNSVPRAGYRTDVIRESFKSGPPAGLGFHLFSPWADPGRVSPTVAFRRRAPRPRGGPQLVLGLIRPKSSPADRSPARKRYCITLDR